MKRVVIVGAGMAGLALGWRFLQDHEPVSLTILEKDSRVGGWVRTQSDSGFLFEEGPHSLSTKGGIETLALIEALGLQEQVIPAAKSARRRYLYVDGKLQSLPTGLWSYLTSPLMKGVTAALYREWRTPARGSAEDESIDAFIERRFSRFIADRFFDPLVSGIYAGEMRQLSVAACFPRLPLWEQREGSVMKGMLKAVMWGTGGSPQSHRDTEEKRQESSFISKMKQIPLFSFHGGMQTLVDALARPLSPYIKCSCACVSLELGPQEITVVCQNGRRLAADLVYLALPAEAALGLLKDAGFQDEMPTIEVASLAVVNMGWRRDILRQRGFGHLIPSSEGEDLLGVIWDSSAFPQQNRHAEETRLTAMMGGARRPDLLQLSRGELAERALRGIREQLEISAEPDAIKVTLARQAIPQYAVGHVAKVETFEHALKVWSRDRIRLAGSSWHGVSLNELCS